MGVDASGFSLRELTWMAYGRWEGETLGVASAIGTALGGSVESLIHLNPYKVLSPLPRDLSDALEEQENREAWEMMGAYFRNMAGTR